MMGDSKTPHTPGRMETLLTLPGCTYIEWKTDGPNGMFMRSEDVLRIAREDDAENDCLRAQVALLRAVLELALPYIERSPLEGTIPVAGAIERVLERDEC